MLDRIPDSADMTSLVGEGLYEIWLRLCEAIEEKYDTDRLWNSACKSWVYEYKYRRGGKTLCGLYAKKDCIGLMLIFGVAEREKFELCREQFSESVQSVYDEATTYHDGKWMMFLPTDTSGFDDYIKLLGIKRRPNKK